MRLANEHAGKSSEQLAHICQMECKAACCRAGGQVSLARGEAERLRAEVERRGLVLRLRQDNSGLYFQHADQKDGRCPFLDGDSCAIYEERPNACRHFPEAPELDGCRLAGWHPKPTIFVASVHGKDVPTHFVGVRESIILELIRAGMYGGDEYFHSVRVDHNRNLCVEAFLKTQADYLLFLDDDMAFPRVVGQRLLSHGKDIVCGLYFQRCPEDPYPHLYRYSHYGAGQYGQAGHLYLEMRKEVHELLRDAPLEDSPLIIEGKDLLIPVDAGGTGCCLIHRRVFEGMKPPWFRTEGATNGDLMFFRKAKEAGYEVWADLGCIATHFCWRGLGLGTFLQHEGAVVNSKEYWDGQHQREYGQLRTCAGLDETVKGLVQSFTNSELTVADFGCGRSTLHETIHQMKGCRIIGIDQAESAQLDNRRRLPEDIWLVADVRATGLLDGVADMTFSNSVVEHLADPQRLIDEMWRVTKPGGLMVLGVPLDLPHKEHVMVYDYDAIVAMLGTYSWPLYLYPLNGRAVVAVQKPSAPVVVGEEAAVGACAS